MIPRPNFTDDEKSKMGEYLAKKIAFEEKRRILLQELEEVEAKITEMQGGYGAIYNKRNPILRLPVEVTCLIFIFAQLPTIDDSEDDASEEDEEDEEDDILMEVVVSHVCRQWRSISLGFPKLWASFSYEAETSVDAPLERFDTYVKRSAAFPLRILFDFQSEGDDPDNVLLVEKAVEQAHRWQHFTMYASDETVMHPLYLLHDVSAPMLEYFTVVSGIDFSDELDDLENDGRNVMTGLEPRIFKGGAPKLTYLMLDGHPMRHVLPPLSNITILRIEKQGCDNVPVFERTPFLELLSLPSLCQLSLCGDLIEPFGSPRSILMPSLKRFRVGEFDAIWELLPSIRAPQLDTLIIHMCQFTLAGATPTSPDGGYTFPALRKLYIIDASVEPSIAPAFAHITSQATEVLISHGNLPSSIIQTIVNGRFTDTVWPRLKVLSCNIPEMETIDTYVSFSKNRPRTSFVFRLHPTLFEFWGDGLAALQVVATVVLDEWELDEPFWPLDTDHDFGKDDAFSIGDYF